MHRYDINWGGRTFGIIINDNDDKIILIDYCNRCKITYRNIMEFINE